jgi:hypothetical protein
MRDGNLRRHRVGLGAAGLLLQVPLTAVPRLRVFLVVHPWPTIRQAPDERPPLSSSAQARTSSIRKASELRSVVIE